VLGQASEYLVGLLNPSAAEYAERTVIPLLADTHLVSPMAYSSKGKPMPAMGWVADERNQEWLWLVSELMVKNALEQDNNKPM
jgi:hypothetical protein